MASVASQLIEEVIAHARGCARDMRRRYFPNNLRIYMKFKYSVLSVFYIKVTTAELIVVKMLISTQYRIVLYIL
jgi:hypothetical protein